jgi:hypothetical protein
MDADLQDDPEEIPKFLALRAEGFDVVSGWKRRRHDPLSRRLASRVFNAGTRRASGLPLHDFNCGLKAYSLEAAREIASSCYGELHRYLPMLAHSKGFRVTEKVVNHRPRTSGRSNYGLERYVRGGVDLVTTIYLTRYARRPMHLFGGSSIIAAGVGVTSLTAGSLIHAVTRGRTHSAVWQAVGTGGLVLAAEGFFLGIIAEVLAGERAHDIPHIVRVHVPQVVNLEGTDSIEVVVDTLETVDLVAMPTPAFSDE